MGLRGSRPGAAVWAKPELARPRRRAQVTPRGLSDEAVWIRTEGVPGEGRDALLETVEPSSCGEWDLSSDSDQPALH
jgi:hypothetical protein